MKMLYITQSETNSGFFDWGNEKYIYGHTKKMLDQIEVFCTLGIDTKFYDHLKLRKIQKVNVWDKVKLRLPYSSVYSQIIYTDAINGYDAYYIRVVSSDYNLYRFLKKLRKNNLYAKILLEFPNMDYGEAFSHRMIDMPIYWKIQHFFKKTEKIIDRSITMNGSHQFKNYKNIPIINGIVTKRIKAIDNSQQFDYNEIHLGMVAGFWPVHGVDILIESLHQYYLNVKKEKKIFIHLVGVGPYMSDYHELVKKYHLEDYVFFYGHLLNEQLDQIYEKFDIGICEMAAFRREYPISSCLKSREYLAKGLPMVSSIKNDAIKEGYPYFKLIETSKGVFNMKEIVSFYEEVYRDKEVKEVRDEIRHYAEENVEMQVTLKPIIDYLKIEDK